MTARQRALLALMADGMAHSTSWMANKLGCGAAGAKRAAEALVERGYLEHAETVHKLDGYRLGLL